MMPSIRRGGELKCIRDIGCKTKASFGQMRNGIHEMINGEKKLPDQVFRPCFNHFFFYNFDLS